MIQNQINKINRVCIRDGYELMYSDPLNLEIDIKYGSALLDALVMSIKDNHLTMRKIIYSVSLEDADGNPLYKFSVDSYRTVCMDDGCRYERIGKLDDILSEIEQRYQLIKKINEHIPGEKYYQLINLANTAYLRELKIIPIDDSINLCLSEKVLNSLRLFEKKVLISSRKTKSYNIAFVINIYNVDGNRLYTIHIDDKKKAYTSSGYELSGIFLNQFIDSIMTCIPENNK